jgi:hypothetical protein
MQGRVVRCLSAIEKLGLPPSRAVSAVTAFENGLACRAVELLRDKEHL